MMKLILCLPVPNELLYIKQYSCVDILTSMKVMKVYNIKIASDLVN